MPAKNGEEALKLYVDNNCGGSKIDVIISDIDMPKGDGRSLCKKIREYEERKKVAKSLILMISGNDNESTVKELLNKKGDYRADLFLKKPISYEELLDCLGKFLI